MNWLNQHSRTRHVAFSLLLMAGIAWLSGCGTGAKEVDQGPLEIAGTYTDGFGTTHTINSDTWSDSFGFVFEILGYSNKGNLLLAQNDPDNAFSAGLFSKFVWTNFNGDLYYCQAAYNATSLEEAAAKAADDSDLTARGCDTIDDFPWTNLTP